MAKSFYVYSTASADTTYVNYHPLPEGAQFHEIKDRVLIKGGAGVANRNMITPRGVMTRVNEQERDLLINHGLFQQHMKDGFVTITESNVDPEVVVADMVQRDGSSPLVEGDFGKDDPKVVVNADSGKDDDDEDRKKGRNF